MSTPCSAPLDRRQAVRLGLAASVSAAMSLVPAGRRGGGAAAQGSPPASAPRRGGHLGVLYWQGPTLLNPLLAVGARDVGAGRLFYEPLASLGPDGALQPCLAAEIPTVQNGSVARDGTWVRWRLKPGVTWHDGRPFTADDVVFTWEMGADPATGATLHGVYRDIERVEKQGDHAVRIVFREPAPFWAEALCGAHQAIVPRHVFDAYRGSRAREAPANLRPVGTGPFRCLEFRPGDLIRAERFAGYHVAGRPYLDSVELKGGGDAVSAARAVLQTGQYDVAWNVQAEAEVLRRLEEGGRGRLLVTPTQRLEHIQVNLADPGREVDGERSHPDTRHPILNDPAVRQALALLVDRAGIQAHVYGRLAQATGNVLDLPARYASTGGSWAFDVARAGRLLEAAGWTRGPDGIRTRQGLRLRLVFQTVVNAARQKTQAIVKQACGRAGIDLELKAVAAGTVDLNEFVADLQMFFIQGGLDPQRYLERFTSWQVPTRANRWAGGNNPRWRSEEYDRLWKAARHEMDPAARTARLIRLNDLILQHGVVVPIVRLHQVTAVGGAVQGVAPSPWDVDFWNVADWSRGPA